MIRSQTPAGIDVFHDHTGEQRMLSRLVPDLVKMRASLPLFSDHFPVMPRSQWREIDNRGNFPWILNQGQYGSCTNHAFTGAQRKTRIAFGMKDVELSATFGYSQKNGGQDNGAQVHDILDVGMSLGNCLMTDFTERTIYQHQVSASQWAQCLKNAPRFKVTGAWLIDNDTPSGTTPFDLIMTGIQIGFFPAFALQVGNNYENFDRDGMVGFSQGEGNHALHGDGAKSGSTGKWLIDTPGSWGGQWGPTTNGRAFTGEAHLNSCQQDAYIVRIALVDPENPDPAVS